MMGQLPFSQACENNKGAIAAALRSAFANRRQVLEIGSGTGQHACHFAAQLPHLRWQPTDLPDNLPFLHARIAAFEGDNLLPERAFDVRDEPWTVAVPDAVFTANSLHIMSSGSVEKLFCGLAAGMTGDTVLAVYGPFNYGGRYTSESNARFDEWLSQQHPDSGIRDFETVDALAREAGMSLQQDLSMPANNRLIVWQSAGTKPG